MSDGMIRVRTAIDTSRWTPGEVTFRPMDHPPEMPHQLVTEAYGTGEVWPVFYGLISDFRTAGKLPPRKQDWSPRDPTGQL